MQIVHGSASDPTVTCPSGTICRSGSPVRLQRIAAGETSQRKLQSPITTLGTLVHSISSGRKTNVKVSQSRKRLTAANVTQQPLTSRPDCPCSNSDIHLSTQTHVCILMALVARLREDLRQLRQTYLWTPGAPLRLRVRHAARSCLQSSIWGRCYRYILSPVDGERVSLACKGVRLARGSLTISFFNDRRSFTLTMIVLAGDARR
jgi:hypothetical protein